MIYLFLVFIFILGLSIGSFLNCLIWRVHKEESMMNRSYCPKCKKMINWYDNIPVFSYLALGGRCRHCHKKISWQYPLVELIFGILFLLVFVKNITGYSFFDLNLILLLVRDWFFIGIIVFVFVFDLRWFLIPDIVTLPAIVFLLIINLFLGASWQAMLVSALIGGGFFLVQFLISKGKWIGGGDIRIGILMGVFFVNWNYLLLAIFSSYLLGSVIGIFLISFKQKKWGSELPLGVFLALGSIITYFFGVGILNWYFSL